MIRQNRGQRSRSRFASFLKEEGDLAQAEVVAHRRVFGTT